MSNKEHVSILMSGVAEWNDWRRNHQDVIPDLSGLNLAKANLYGADLKGAVLYKCDLRRAKLLKVDWSHKPTSWTRQNELESGPEGRGTSYQSGADLRGAMLAQAIIRDADLTRVILSSADLSGCDLSGAIMRAAHLLNTNLSEANLGGVDFRGANLAGANLYRARLGGANLSGADITETNLRGASLSHALFSRTRMDRADLKGAQLGDTIFASVDLRKVSGLAKAQHSRPSTIGIDTLYLSNGEIPETFLRGAGLPDTLITYARSLVGQALEFYSCFISYSSADQDFADRLYSDLQAKGVRCWFAPKDLRIGDKFRNRIDESIRVFDKSLLILSRFSILSPWVEDEVEAALELERLNNRLVLFPIRLDDAIMETDIAWAAHLRQKRHIGDFRGWKEHDTHRTALQRLLRDLRSRPSAPCADS